MSSGKRYKYQGSHIKVLTGYRGGSPFAAITGITAADPPVVTSAGHGLSNGDVVYIDNVAGTVEVNQSLYIVANKATDTFELYGVKGATWTAYTSGGTFDPGTFSEFCEVTSGPNRTGGSKTETPATTVCSTEEEFEVGIGGQGTMAIAYNYAPLTSTVQVAMDAFDRSGDIMAIKVQLPKNGGTITRLGFVQQTSEQGQVNGIWTASANLRLTGPAYRQAAA